MLFFILIVKAIELWPNLDHLGFDIYGNYKFIGTINIPYYTYKNKTVLRFPLDKAEQHLELPVDSEFLKVALESRYHFLDNDPNRIMNLERYTEMAIGQIATEQNEKINNAYMNAFIIKDKLDLLLDNERDPFKKILAINNYIDASKETIELEFSKKSKTLPLFYRVYPPYYYPDNRIYLSYYATQWKGPKLPYINNANILKTIRHPAGNRIEINLSNSQNQALLLNDDYNQRFFTLNNPEDLKAYEFDPDLLKKFQDELVISYNLDTEKSYDKITISFETNLSSNGQILFEKIPLPSGNETSFEGKILIDQLSITHNERTRLSPYLKIAPIPFNNGYKYHLYLDYTDIWEDPTLFVWEYIHNNDRHRQYLLDSFKNKYLLSKTESMKALEYAAILPNLIQNDGDPAVADTIFYLMAHFAYHYQLTYNFNEFDFKSSRFKLIQYLFTEKLLDHSFIDTDTIENYYIPLMMDVTTDPKVNEKVAKRFYQLNELIIREVLNGALNLNDSTVLQLQTILEFQRSFFSIDINS